MLYHTADKNLTAFMRNPLKHIDYLKNDLEPPGLVSRFIYRVPFLRKYINSKDVFNLFRFFLIALAKNAEDELREIEPLSIQYNDRYLNSCISELSKYFLLTIQDNVIDQGTDIELVRGHASVHFGAKMEYHTNRIMEAFSLNAEHSISILKSRHLWALFFLSEILFLIETNQMILSMNNSGFDVKKSPVLQANFKSYWLSEVTEANSKNTDTFSISMLAQSIKEQEKISPIDLNEHVDLLLDKIFSIHTKYLTSEIKALPVYKLLRDIVALSLLVEGICGPHSYVERHRIYKLRVLMDDNIEFIDEALLDFNDKKFGSFSNFITFDGKCYRRGSLGFKFGIKRFVGALIHRYQKNRDSFFDKYGDSFQDDYVVQRLKNLKSYGYRVIDGFEPDSQNSKVRGYDIDVVLHDVEDNIFYFIQIKYCASFIPTYLAEQCDFFNDSKSKLKYGYKQLDILRKNFEDESIRKILDSKGLNEATIDNSYFLLVHNIPFLNFYEYEGIYLYEWNLLRNILREGLSLKISKNEVEEKYVGKKFPLHNPQVIVNEYISSGVIENATEEFFDLFSSSKSCLNILGEEITCDMI